MRRFEVRSRYCTHAVRCVCVACYLVTHVSHVRNVTSSELERLDLYRLPRMSDRALASITRFVHLRKLEVNDSKENSVKFSITRN